ADALIRVVGDIYFGIILSVLNGKNSRGIVNLIFPPISLMSKNGSSGFRLSLDAPMEPMAETSRISAPLKIFRIKSPVLKENPTDWMLLCITSVLKFNPNRFLGFR